MARPRPYDHQTRALAASAGRTAFAYFMEMGTGKSRVLLDDAARAWAAGEIDRLVVVAGKGSYANWTNYEIPLHLHPSIPSVVHLWTGADTGRERRLLNLLECEYTTRVLRILVVHAEALSTSERARKMFSQFVGGGPAMVAVDESTLIKNHESERADFLIRESKTAVHRRILTGYPVTRDPIDLWGQFEFLGTGLLGHHSFYSFRARYAIMRDIQVATSRRDRNGNVVLRKTSVPVSFRNLEELAERVAKHAFRVTKEECLDLPPKIYQYRDVEMTPEQAEHYRTMRDLSLAQVGDSLSTAKNALGIVLKLQQILSGYVVSDDRVVHELPNRRMEALLAAIEETGIRSTIVWCLYRTDLQNVARQLRERYGAASTVTYWGDSTPAEMSGAIERFQSGDATFFVSTLAKGYRGITLTKARTVVYYSNSIDLEHRVQSEDRAHRIGQHFPVNYVDLRVLGTVDVKIIEALRSKRVIASLLAGDEAREWLQ